jgi:hypothetical protein
MRQYTVVKHRSRGIAVCGLRLSRFCRNLLRSRLEPSAAISQPFDGPDAMEVSKWQPLKSTRTPVDSRGKICSSQMPYFRHFVADPSRGQPSAQPLQGVEQSLTTCAVGVRPHRGNLANYRRNQNQI